MLGDHNVQFESNLNKIYHGCLGFRNANNGMVKEGLLGHSRDLLRIGKICMNGIPQGTLNANEKLEDGGKTNGE